MKIKKFSLKPADIKSRVGAKPVVCYSNDNINDNLHILHESRKHIKQIDEVIVPPRDARTFNVKSVIFLELKVLKVHK